MRSNRNSFQYLIIILLSASVLTTACRRTPEGILDEAQMTDLLVDIYKSESIIELERSRYYPDSIKKALKQSVYLRHGVTPEQVDESYQWYGHHIEDYLKIHDNVISQLENEIETQSGTKIIFQEGDSIDVWPTFKVIRQSEFSPQSIYAFNLNIDDSFKRGDNFNLQFTIIDPSNAARITSALFAEYQNNTTDFKYIETSFPDSKSSLRLVLDSLSDISAIHGYIRINNPLNKPVYIDSISLTRTRKQAANYNLRHSQRRLKMPLDE